MVNWDIDSYIEVEKNNGDIDLDVENIDNTTDTNSILPKSLINKHWTKYEVFH